MTFNPVRHAFQTMLADQKYRGLPLLTASDYTPFLSTSHALQHVDMFANTLKRPLKLSSRTPPSCTTMPGRQNHSSIPSAAQPSAPRTVMTAATSWISDVIRARRRILVAQPSLRAVLFSSLLTGMCWLREEVPPHRQMRCSMCFRRLSLWHESMSNMTYGWYMASIMAIVMARLY